MKVVLLDNNSNVAADLQHKLAQLAIFTELTTVNTAVNAIATIENLAPDFVAMPPALAKDLLCNQASLLQPTVLPKRLHISHHTRQGIQLLHIAEIIYFHAEQKYVAAYHLNGMVLLTDTLNSLEQEFGELFVRIHRQTLVATNQIKALNRDANDNWFILLIDSKEQLAVSRRQLPIVRKHLKKYAGT